MGRRRLHPKRKPKLKWYQKQDDWGNFVFDWSLGLSAEIWRTIFSIVIFIIAVMIFLGFLGKAGVLGKFFADGAQGMFGLLGGYIFDFILAYISFRLIVAPRKRKNRGGYRISEFVGLAIFLFTFPTFCHLFLSVDYAQEPGIFTRYGGIIGYMFSVPLRNAVGDLASFLIVVAILLISIQMIFDFSIFKALGMTATTKGSDDDDEEEDEDDNDGKLRVNNRQEAKVSVFESVRKRFGMKKKPKYEEIEPKAAVVDLAPTSGTTNVPIKKDIVWQYPSLDLLKELDEVANPGNIYKNAEMIQKCLATFGITVSMGDANVGPTVTQYTIKPDDGVKLNQIVARQNDLALTLAAKSIRIEAPIPGKNAVGIEIPNKVAAKVTLKEILKAPQFKAIKSKLALALGRDVAGEPSAIDLEKMPHLLIAGSTGSGKSVCINSIIVALLFNNDPKDLRMLLVDPKRVELTCYNEIPHLLTPVVIEVDKTVAALKWAVWEMERRYKMFSELGKRNIVAYNSAPGPEGKLPYIVIIVDELADLMATSSKEVEGSIVRLAQMARATGMHLIIATQRPSVDVLTGLIKANIASRIAFATASQVDSRTILDMSGAEKLLGFGDMLFMAAGAKPKRVQGCYVSDPEIEQLVAFLKNNAEPNYDESILSFGSSRHGGGAGINGSSEDDLYSDALDTVVNAGKASASLLQRRLKVGYARAARLLDILEENGAIGPADGARPRDVLVSTDDVDRMGGGEFVSTYEPDSNKDIDKFI